MDVKELKIEDVQAECDKFFQEVNVNPSPLTKCRTDLVERFHTMGPVGLLIDGFDGSLEITLDPPEDPSDLSATEAYLAALTAVALNKLKPENLPPQLHFPYCMLQASVAAMWTEIRKMEQAVPVPESPTSAPA